MPTSFENDLNLFLPSDSDAKAATLDGRTVRGYFDENFSEFDFSGDSVEGRNYTFYLKSSDLGNAARGSVLVVDSKTYKVTEFKPDGDGAFTELVLQL